MDRPLELKSWQGAMLATLIIAVLMVTIWAFVSVQPKTALNTEANNQPTPTPTIASPTPTPTPDPALNTDGAPVSHDLRLYMVALEEGQEQELFGCGDRLQSVSTTITTTTPLRAVLTELLDYPDQHYGQSGLYNALHPSDLSVESISISEGRADIKLSGSIGQHGACDAPRIERQLRATAQQFATVTSVNITVNDQPLDQVLNHQDEDHQH